MEDLIEASRLCPSNREIQRLLSRVKEECRQAAQQDCPPPSSHYVRQPAIGTRHRDSEEDEEEEERRVEGGGQREGEAPPPSSVYPQPLDTYCQPVVQVPASRSSTHLYHHVSSPTHSPPSTSGPSPPSSSYHCFSSPPSPMQHQQRVSTMSESMPVLSGAGLPQHLSSASALHLSDHSQGAKQHHHLANQRCSQRQNPAQAQWLQPAKVHGVRGSQQSVSGHSGTALGSSTYSQFAQLPQELAALGEGICPRPLDIRPGSQVQTGLSTGASNPLEDMDVDQVCQAYSRGAGGERTGGGGGFGQVRQFSRNLSKAAYYPMELTEVTMEPPDSALSHDHQFHHQGGLRSLLGAHPTSAPPPPPRPLIHSQSVNVRFSSSSSSLAGGHQANQSPVFRTPASSRHVDLTPDPASVGGLTAYQDDLLLISSPQADLCMVGGGTYPGDAGRSSRNTPFMGVIDKTGRVQPYQQQAPSGSASTLSPSRSWAVSSVDTVITSPTKTPPNPAGFSQPQPFSIAYHNRSNNNAHNGHFFHDNQFHYGDVLPANGAQADGSGQVAGQSPSYFDVKLARTLPVLHSFSDRLSDRKTCPASPVKPKRPFVESNV